MKGETLLIGSAALGKDITNDIRKNAKAKYILPFMINSFFFIFYRLFNSLTIDELTFPVSAIALMIFTFISTTHTPNIMMCEFAMRGASLSYWCHSVMVFAHDLYRFLSLFVNSFFLIAIAIPKISQPTAIPKKFLFSDTNAIRGNKSHSRYSVLFLINFTTIITYSI